jgi:uncharacterized MAPEG superfamily protein
MLPLRRLAPVLPTVASRPIEASKAAVCYVRKTSFPAVHGAPPALNHIYKHGGVLNGISVVSKSCYGRSLSLGELSSGECRLSAPASSGATEGETMSELICLELSVVLWIAHVLVQAFTARAEFGDQYLFSPRDQAVTAKGVLAGRATRALHNYVENLGPFIAMALGLIATGHTGGIGGVGAIIWLLARIVYLPIYLAGTLYVRTAAWAVSVIGLLMMLWRLAFS